MEVAELPVPLASGCDTPVQVEEPLVPLVSSPKSPIVPVVQIRQYSWHYSDKHDASDIRREFVGTNKRTNPDSLFLPQQKPLVSKVHLMKVVRKIGQQKRSRGEHLTVNMFKKPFSNGEKNVTSSSIPAQKIKGGNISYSVMCNAGIRIINPKYSHISDKCTVNSFKMQEKEREREDSLPGRPDDDDIITSLKSDVNIRETVWDADVNRLVARKHFVPRKRSLPYSVGSFKELLKACGRIVSFIALYLAIVTNVLGGVTNIIRYGKKSTVGNSDSLPRRESSGDYSCPYSLSIFRKCLDNILRFNKESWSYGIIYPIWKENKSFRKGKEELWKLGIRLVIAMSWLRNLQLGNVCKETFCLRSGNIAKTFLVGKCFRAYLRLFADFCASCRDYSYIYTVNLEFEDKFKRFYDYIYLYIYDFYRCRLSYE